MVKKAKRPEPVQPISQGQGEGPAPVQPLTQGMNKAMTGYFNDGRKRIDIVLVFKDDGSNVIKETRVNFLMNVIQFGLEAEVDLGKMCGHRDLMFVKLHAPDAIIEECGLYFNEKSFFKDSHLEFINPIVNIFGLSNERELIKIVRNQYPGPDNYSTLERSNIVYKILLQIPFGKYSNHFGLNKLIDNNIILDAFALHDGPYFIELKQSNVHMNARQVLYVAWLGMLNVWKTQPIHIIHEYFGKRISYYFAFYEYFNFMLIIPWMFGVYTTFLMTKATNYEDYTKYTYKETHKHNSLPFFVHPECRNITLCPMLTDVAYTEELQLLARIDKESTIQFGQFMAIWGIFFLMPWRYIERYLDWSWEETKKYTNKLVRPEYEEREIKMEEEKNARSIKTTKNPGSRLRMFIYLLTVTCLGLWAFVMFRFSIVIWHYPRYRRLEYSLTHEKHYYILKHDENINIAVGAVIYTITICIIKMVFTALAQKVTRYENNRTFLIQERSFALKLYTFSYIGTFMILITLSYLGGLHVHLHKSKKDPEVDPSKFGIFGYWRMNSGLGSTLDDISITLGVITILEHVIFRMIGFLRKDKTDDPVIFKSRVPCWEREYQLKPITELFFHKRYNALAMQFALLTCYSMTFPMATLILFITNIWDLRHIARQLLLEYRRPLLINTSGPGFWKYLILITALYAPLSNAAIVVFQSFTFALRYFSMKGNHPVVDTYACHSKEVDYLKGAENDYSLMITLMTSAYDNLGNLSIDSCTTVGYFNESYREMHLEMVVRFLLMTTVFGIVIFLFLFYILPRTSNSLEDAIKNEWRIKYKYQTRRNMLEESL